VITLVVILSNKKRVERPSPLKKAVKMNAPIRTQDESHGTGHECEQGESHLVFANGVEEKRDELPPHSQDKAGDKLRKCSRQGFHNTVSCKPAPFSPTQIPKTKYSFITAISSHSKTKPFHSHKRQLRDTLRKFFSVSPQTVGRRFLY
jgi:hypothetical protein